MFTSDLIETRTNQVKMNTEHSTLTSIINYAYTGTIDLNIDNVQNIFTLSSQLQITDILNACSSLMQKNLDINNSIHVYDFAKRHMTSIDLLNNTKEFINKNIIHILKTNEFMELDDPEIIRDLLSSDELDVLNEIYVLEYLLKWINFKMDTRRFYFEGLIKDCVRLSLIENESLKELYHANGLGLRLKNLIEAHLKENGFKEEKKRIGMNKAGYCFMLVGGNCNFDDGSYVNCFNPHTSEKFFLSRDFQQKTRSTSKGYFHIENPGDFYFKSQFCLLFKKSAKTNEKSLCTPYIIIIGC